MNVAGRMQSTSVPRRVQGSWEVFLRLETQFQWEAMGRGAVKGKGEMEMKTHLLAGPAPTTDSAAG